MSSPIQPEQTSTTEPQVTEPQVTEADDPFAEEREKIRAQVRQETLAEAAQVYGGALSEAEKRAREYEERLKTTSQASTTPVKQVDSTEFFTDPHTHTRELVRQELAAAVGPLNDFVAQQRNQSAYQMIKQQLSMNPQLAPHMASISHQLDLEAAQLQVINQNTVGMLAINIIGRAVAGFLPGVTLGGTTAAPVAQIPQRMSAPPQVPPASPATAKPVTQKIELTEQQLAVARMNGQTPEQYIAWTNSDGNINTLRGLK